MVPQPTMLPRATSPKLSLYLIKDPMSYLTGSRGHLPWSKAAETWIWSLLHLVPRLKMRETVPLFPHTPSWRGTYLSMRISLCNRDGMYLRVSSILVEAPAVVTDLSWISSAPVGKYSYRTWIRAPSVRCQGFPNSPFINHSSIRQSNQGRQL
jgi:hypothetical protein